MKPQNLLPLCAASALARSSISNNLNVGICRRSLNSLSYPPFPEPAICGHHPTNTLHNIVEDPHWTHASPCHRNGTTQFCVYHAMSFAENRGISIMTSPERAAMLAKSLALTDPEVTRGVNQDIDPDPNWRPAYRVEAIPGKGMGVVADRFIAAGDRLMSSTSTILIDYKMYRAVPDWEMRRLQGYAIDYLPYVHRTKFLNLSTDHVTDMDHLRTVDKILATNGFDVELGLDNDDDDNWYTVFPEISRFNHACRPNADYYFDAETLTQHIHAVRPIATGEEITVSYIGPVSPRADRMDKLKRTWGFPCSCSHCTKTNLHAGESDDRILQIEWIRKEFNDMTSKSRATPQMAELMVSLYEQEHLHILMYEAYSYAALEWNGVGEPYTAMKYARLAIEAGLSSVGPDNSDVVMMDELLEDPWSHWSWMSRTSRRMRWGKKGRGKDDEEEEEE